MKKMILLILAISPLFLKAQYSAEIETWADNPVNDIWTYVGSLPPTSGSNLHKLKVEVFGGQWVNSNGETTYYISNREVIVVNKVVMGSGNDDQFTLRAFTSNSGGLDFYIFTPGNSYAAYAVRSCLLGGTNLFYNISGNGSAQQLVPVTVQALSPGILPSSNPEQQLTVNPILVTDAWGNIGVSTAKPDPAYKFSVNGKMRVKEVKVEANWADYVFDDAYRLRSLKEVEAYINDNKHLPDVPSATEVKENGINVGESNAMLLKKIEELTLYMIELKKELGMQQAEIDDLKKNR